MTEIKISEIIRTKRRTIALQVCPDAALIIRAPFKASDNYINRLVERKRRWITRRQEAVKQQNRLIKDKEFVSGEGFMYLGETYKLYVEGAQCAPLVFDNAFHLAGDYQARGRQAFIKWYKEQARYKIPERASLYLSKTGLQCNKIGITNARGRWGSCSRNGNLNFTWRLIMAPLPVIDYVAAHEVAHLEHKNHSREFWNKVMALAPNYKQHRKWLRENEHLLRF
jgi:hypothetical protein